MTTTIKISKETRERLAALDLTEKGKSFDIVVNELITFYTRVHKGRQKDVREWRKSFSNYKKEVKEYEEKKAEWEKLLKWAKSKGFKP